MLKYLCMTAFISLIGLNWSLAQTNTAAKPVTTTKPMATKKPKLVQKQPAVKPLQPDGVIRVENEKPKKPLIVETAEDISNKVPPGFVELMLTEGKWIDAVEKAGTPANMQMQGLISAFTSGMAANSIAQQVIADDETYKLKIELIHYFENASPVILRPYRLNSERLSQIKNQIAKKYLDAIFILIEGSTIVDYKPIVEELRSQLERKSITIVDLTPQLRRAWNEEKTQMKVHQYENFGLEQKKDNDYLINGLYIEAKKTLAFDLNRSKYENLVTIAHEIVHAADPELIKHKEKLNNLFGKVISKLKPHVAASDAELFIRALIQDTFYEMGRFDMAEAMQKLREEQVQKLKVSLEKQPLEVLTKDQDFKDFMRSLIAVTVENEYKAYTLSYALYQNLKNEKIVPPLLSRNNFMQEQFKHKHSLAFTLSVAMNPFAKNTHMEYVNRQLTPELRMIINQIKTIFEINYLEQSKVMIQEVGERYFRLFEMIKRHNEMMSDENVPYWTKPGNMNSATNPFDILEAKISTAWTLRFKLNLQAFLKKIMSLQESLLTMRAGVMDLHDVSFGELKLLGMQPETIKNPNGQWEENRGQYLPSTLSPECKSDVLKQILSGSADNTQNEEYLSYFNELRWAPETTSDLTPVPEATVKLNLYRLNLLKAVRWLRIELPQSQENIVGIKTMLAKLNVGKYNPEEISKERAAQMADELRAYMQAAAFSGEEFNNLDALMTAVSQMYYLALEDKWQPVYEEFHKRIKKALEFLDDNGFQPTRTYKQIVDQMALDVTKFRDDVRGEFAACASPPDIDYYSRLKKLQLGRFSFPVTGICHNKNLYIFRQTCDFNRSASTTVPRGKPHTKIFIGGREIILDPFISYK